MIQKLLDAAAAAGGGLVQLKAGVYYTCQPLILGANVHLRGAGRGATIIRGSQVLRSETVDNAFVGSTIATIGTNNVSVSDLTIDHATCGRNANGVSFLPTGSSGQNIQLYDGVIPTNGLVERVEVLGAPGFHNYLIWNLKGQHMKIVDNWLDGGETTYSPQEGIESFGGYDVTISNNTVKNVGTACINLGSAGLPGSETVGLFVINNYLTNCQAGINLGTSAINGNQANETTHIRGNVITNVREVGIDVPVAMATNQRDLQIANNTIRNVTGEKVIAGSIAGIRLRATDGRLDNSAVTATTLEANHIDEIAGPNGFGIFLLSYPNARILNNTIVSSNNEAIYAYDSADLEIIANRIERAGTVPIGIYQPADGGGIARFVVERNKITDWPASYTGVLVVGGRYGVVRDNVFSRRDALSPVPVTVDSESCGVKVTNNMIWYNVNWPGDSTLPCR